MHYRNPRPCLELSMLGGSTGGKLTYPTEVSLVLVLSIDTRGLNVNSFCRGNGNGCCRYIQCVGQSVHALYKLREHMHVYIEKRTEIPLRLWSAHRACGC